MSNLNLSLTLVDVKLVKYCGSGHTFASEDIKRDIEWAQSGRCHAMAGRQWVIARCLEHQSNKYGILNWIRTQLSVSVNFIPALS